MYKTKILLFAALAFTFLSAKADDTIKNYDKPAKTQQEAVSIGDGTVAATIYGTFPDENIDLTYTTESGATEKMGSITVFHSIPVKRKITRYARGFNPSTDIAFTDITFSDGNLKQQFYAAIPDSVLIIEYSDEVALNSTVFLKSDFATDVRSFDDLITLKGKFPGKNGNGEDFTTLLKVIPGTGGMITTNPDASLAICNIKGVKLIISTVKSQASDLAKLRIFRTSLKLKAGLDKYRENADVPQLADYYTSYTTTESTESESNGEKLTFTNIETTDSLGNPVVAMRTSPNRIEFLPYIEFAEVADGGIENVNVLGSFSVSFIWEKGKVTGGLITYIPKDYMPIDTTVELILNGESNKVDFHSGQTVPLENFIELVRPFIQ